MSKHVRRLTELAVLTAVSLIIFIVELQIPNPFPIPGIKLGLANIITVYAVYHYKAHEVAAVIAARLLLGAVFSGNIAALVYSASGSAL
ncbi:MAG: Gx transporter family protein, partial [Ruminococcus sp.]|nr:Gx transporter family protein [Ruminococcus sp.]